MIIMNFPKINGIKEIFMQIKYKYHTKILLFTHSKKDHLLTMYFCGIFAAMDKSNLGFHSMHKFGACFHINFEKFFLSFTTFDGLVLLKQINFSAKNL